jgi:hypothetical protein
VSLLKLLSLKQPQKLPRNRNDHRTAPMSCVIFDSVHIVIHSKLVSYPRKCESAESIRDFPLTLKRVDSINSFFCQEECSESANLTKRKALHSPTAIPIKGEEENKSFWREDSAYQSHHEVSYTKNKVLSIGGGTFVVVRNEMQMII